MPIAEKRCVVLSSNIRWIPIDCLEWLLKNNTQRREILLQNKFDMCKATSTSNAMTVIFTDIWVEQYRYISKIIYLYVILCQIL